MSQPSLRPVSAHSLKAQSRVSHAASLFMSREVEGREAAGFVMCSGTVKSLHPQRPLGSSWLGADIVKTVFVLKSLGGVFNILNIRVVHVPSLFSREIV